LAARRSCRVDSLATTELLPHVNSLRILALHETGEGLADERGSFRLGKREDEIGAIIVNPFEKTIGRARGAAWPAIAGAHLREEFRGRPARGTSVARVFSGAFRRDRRPPVSLLPLLRWVKRVRADAPAPPFSRGERAEQAVAPR